jgi:hypothetical protein
MQTIYESTRLLTWTHPSFPDYPFFSGTGFLFTWRGHYVLATARHCIDASNEARLEVAANIDDVIPFSAPVVISERDPDDDDYADLALFFADPAKLTAAQVDVFRRVDLAKLAQWSEPWVAGDALVVPGFPSQLQDIDHEGKRRGAISSASRKGTSKPATMG